MAKLKNNQFTSYENEWCIKQRKKWVLDKSIMEKQAKGMNIKDKQTSVQISTLDGRWNIECFNQHEYLWIA